MKRLLSILSLVALTACAGANKVETTVTKQPVEQQATKDLDTIYYEKSLAKAYISNIGVSRSWVNMQTKNHGAVTAVEEFENMHGEYCRKFIVSLFKQGEQTKEKIARCQNKNGIWQEAHNTVK